ncbi:uncharacterized protein LOC131174712 [Hevea brasiliensis]|uniref:uncharacterized protein LOC131174712 n=1 Tax=Hevea brasiliensis TaxID=3981 RepID=UPI0025F8B842|nr:uncharacterized protein LOC131174712 [Hevea brasiliensis]
MGLDQIEEQAMDFESLKELIKPSQIRKILLVSESLWIIIQESKLKQGKRTGRCMSIWLIESLFLQLLLPDTKTHCNLCCYGFQPIHRCGDQVCCSDCMEMPNINNHQSVPAAEPIPSLLPVQPIYGYEDQVYYSDYMEMPTMNNHQSEESISSLQPVQLIYGYGDQVCHSDCMEMPTMNNHQSEEPIPSLQPVQPICGCGDQVCYNECMEIPTMNNHQSAPTRESIPSLKPAIEKNNLELGAQLFKICLLPLESTVISCNF